VGHHSAQGLAPDWAPLCLTDGFRESLPAFLTPLGHWGQPPRRQGQGPSLQPRGLPLPQWRYAQVMKTGRRRRWGRGPPRVGCGRLEPVPRV
jgi:hypothetical protein